MNTSFLYFRELRFLPGLNRLNHLFHQRFRHQKTLQLMNLKPSKTIAVFTGCGDGIVRAYEAKSAVLKRTYTGHEGAVNCLMIVRDKIFSGSSDCTMRVWDASDIR